LEMGNFSSYICHDNNHNEYMKLTDTVIALIGDRKSKEAKAIRSTLALALGCTDQWISLSLKANRDNGLLTTVKAVQIIKKTTGLNQSEILEEEKNHSTAAA
jgi:hypothetical protein